MVTECDRNVDNVSANLVFYRALLGLRAQVLLLIIVFGRWYIDSCVYVVMVIHYTIRVMNLWHLSISMKVGVVHGKLPSCN